LACPKVIELLVDEISFSYGARFPGKGPDETGSILTVQAVAVMAINRGGR